MDTATNPSETGKAPVSETTQETVKVPVKTSKKSKSSKRKDSKKGGYFVKKSF